VEVDREEINKFEELAERWWDPESEFKPLHQINPLRLTWIDNTVDGLNGLSVLDLGCGGGILSEAMAKLGANVTGIDPAERSINVAKIHAEKFNSNVNYLAKSMYESYDVVTCMEMLEHVTSPEKEIEACSSLLKSGGTLIVSTINRNLKSFLFAIVGAEYILQLLPKGTHSYEKFLKPSEIAMFARKCELTELDIIGMTYNPFTKIYKLGNDTDVNYIMAFKKK
jgi:2-polyprenyl-6-hydroxyphenyl methylase/3-demethylubiquinone-9 3-methyltransferase